jgi:hypothetical protein
LGVSICRNDRKKCSFLSAELGGQLASVYPMGFYVEVNLSANGLMKKLENVMNYLNVNPENLQIYLREDRDAEE